MDYKKLGFQTRFIAGLAGMLCCSGALLRFAEKVTDAQGIGMAEVPELAVDVLLLISGAGAVWVTYTGKSNRSLFSLLPGFGIAFWLVLYYHSQSSDPVVERYGAQLLCLMAAALAFYHQAGRSFGRSEPVRSVLFTMVAGVYAFTVLPTAEDVADALLLTAIGLWMLLQLVLLPNTLEYEGERDAERVC